MSNNLNPTSDRPLNIDQWKPNELAAFVVIMHYIARIGFRADGTTLNRSEDRVKLARHLQAAAGIRKVERNVDVVSLDNGETNRVVVSSELAAPWKRDVAAAVSKAILHYEETGKWRMRDATKITRIAGTMGKV